MVGRHRAGLGKANSHKIRLAEDIIPHLRPGCKRQGGIFMPIQTEEYRDQLDRLSARFPNREAISISEAADILGTERRSLLNSKTFPAKRPSGRKNGKIVVPIVALARWMTSKGM